MVFPKRYKRWSVYLGDCMVTCHPNQPQLEGWGVALGPDLSPQLSPTAQPWLLVMVWFAVGGVRVGWTWLRCNDCGVTTKCIHY